MLKQYLRELLTSFLTSKKAWVGTQSICSSRTMSISYEAENQNGMEYIAPANGTIYLRVLSNTNSIDAIEIQNNTYKKGSLVRSDYAGIYLRVKKGESTRLLLRAKEGQTIKEKSTTFIYDKSSA